MTHQVELKGQTSTSGKESFDSTNIRHKVKSKYENEESNGGSNETRSEEIKFKIDATAEVFTTKAFFSEINKPDYFVIRE
jgi:hypothetical protein